MPSSMLKVIRILTHLILLTPHKVDIIIVAICQNEETEARGESFTAVLLVC